MDALRNSKKISLLAVAILFLFTFFTLILDALVLSYSQNRCWPLISGYIVCRLLKRSTKICFQWAICFFRVVGVRDTKPCLPIFGCFIAGQLFSSFPTLIKCAFWNRKLGTRCAGP
jgi:hypothetical protein